jgi:hypothetical protein
VEHRPDQWQPDLSVIDRQPALVERLQRRAPITIAAMTITIATVPPQEQRPGEDGASQRRQLDVEPLVEVLNSG